MLASTRYPEGYRVLLLGGVSAGSSLDSTYAAMLETEVRRDHLSKKATR
jgi:hypothetical protein